MSQKASGEAEDSTLNKDIFSSVECPTCGRDDFKSNRGMRRHHAVTHGESLSEVERECDYCHSKFTLPVAWLRKDGNTGAFCSDECRDKGCDVGVEHDLEYETRVCEYTECENSFEVRPYKDKRFCSTKCSVRDRNPDPHTKKCGICGEEFRTGGKSKAERRKTCSKSCFSEWLKQNYSGENNPSWKGGYNVYYGPNWKEQRKTARERDNHQCQACGVSEEDIERQLSVHHITPFREFDSYEEANKLSNLVTFCEPCHSEWEGLYLRPDTR